MALALSKSCWSQRTRFVETHRTGGTRPSDGPASHSRAWTSVGALCLLFLLADLLLVETGAARSGDRSIDLRLHRDFGSSTYAFFKAVSLVGDGQLRAVLVVALIAVLAGARRYWAAAFSLVAVGGAALLDGAIKLLVHRSRPTLFHHAVSAGGYSFPSGHATDATTFAVVLLYLLWRWFPGRVVMGIGAALGLIFIALVALSRVVLGVHYPTDVAGGVALGLGWCALTIALFDLAGWRRAVL